jgi:two-component system response regulator RpaA
MKGLTIRNKRGGELGPAQAGQPASRRAAEGVPRLPDRPRQKPLARRPPRCRPRKRPSGQVGGSPEVRNLHRLTGLGLACQTGVPAMKKVFTTGQVAKICKVAPRTVSKWFDSGRLKGYRIPGSQDRRIPREQLIKFLKEHGMPLGELEEEEWHKILIIGAEKHFIDRLQELLPDSEDYKYQIANSGFEAGIMAQSFHPDTIIIDLSLGRSEALQIAANLRRDPAYETTLMIALASEDEADPDSLKTAHHFNEAFKKPFDIALLAERIRSLALAKRED